MADSGGKPAQTVNRCSRLSLFGNLGNLKSFGLSIKFQSSVIDALYYEFALQDHQAPVRDAKVSTQESQGLTETSVLVVL